MLLPFYSINITYVFLSLNDICVNVFALKIIVSGYSGFSRAVRTGENHYFRFKPFPLYNILFFRQGILNRLFSA